MNVKPTDPDPLTPHGLALMAYFEGDSTAQLLLRRDDGLETPLPVSLFFRDAAELSPLELAALARCRGRILDVGAGAGLHSLALQAAGREVTALDVCPEAVEIMRRRGVRDVRCGDVFEFRDGPFDTLLLLGHGIGIVEDLRGLDGFLAHARRLTRAGARILAHSLDVRRTDDPVHLAYQEANLRHGRYRGEIRMQFEHAGRTGPYRGWLHVDPDTLGKRAEAAGWRSEVVLELETGDYLAELARSPGDDRERRF